MSAAITVSLPRRRLVAGFTWAVLAIPARAGVDRPTAESLLRIRAGALLGVRQRGAAPTQAEVDRLTQAIDSAYSAQRLRSACLGAASKKLDKVRVARSKETGRSSASRWRPQSVNFPTHTA